MKQKNFCPDCKQLKELKTVLSLDFSSGKKKKLRITKCEECHGHK